MILSGPMRNPIILALDLPNADAALPLTRQLAPVLGAIKIGSELFTASGPQIVRQMRDLGLNVFLDLKFHDIPNTVAKAVASAVQLDVQMLTIHTGGGSEMMRAAERSAQETAARLGRKVFRLSALVGQTQKSRVQRLSQSSDDMDRKPTVPRCRRASAETTAGYRSRRSIRRARP